MGAFVAVDVDFEVFVLSGFAVLSAFASFVPALA